MDEKTRAKKDIVKLTKMLKEFKELGLDKDYAGVLRWAEDYLFDAKYFFNNKEYFTAFGAANYAYGMIDAVLIIEGKKDHVKTK
jgi:hypothetical protein